MNRSECHCGAAWMDKHFRERIAGAKGPREALDWAVPGMPVAWNAVKMLESGTK